MTYDELKKQAKSYGANVDDKPFTIADFPVINVNYRNHNVYVKSIGNIQNLDIEEVKAELEANGAEQVEKKPSVVTITNSYYPAILKDNSDQHITDLVSEYSIETSGDNITVKGTNLKEHENDQKVKGHWIGVAIVPSDKSVDGLKFASGEAALGEKEALEKNVHDTESGLAIYIDHKSDGADTRKFKLQWMKGDEPIGKEFAITINLNNVTNQVSEAA